MSLLELASRSCFNPVDAVERFAATNDLAFERATEDELCISASGKWTTYQVSFCWIDAVEALHVSCAFDLPASDRRGDEVRALVALANQQLWVGHFEAWRRDGLILFRHALILPSGAEPSERQCEMLLETATTACERYYQAFQFVIWAGKSAQEALDAALFETAGEA